MGVEVYLAPRLRLARLRLAGMLSEKYADAGPRVALPCPPELERPLSLYARGLEGWSGLKLRLREALGGFHGSWLWVEEPLVRALPLLKAEVRCYGPRASEFTKRGGELAVLAFRARARGEVSLEEWRRVLGGGAQAPDLSCCDVAVSSRRVEGQVNIEAWPYPYPPSESLDPSNLTREAVLEYVDYVFNYIVGSGSLDEAYLRWLGERRGLKPRELWNLLSMAGRRPF